MAEKFKPKPGWAFSYGRTLAISVVTMTEAKLNKQHLFMIFYNEQNYRTNSQVVKPFLLLFLEKIIIYLFFARYMA